MPQPPDPASPSPGASLIVITVGRSGGFAGLSRTWRVSADAADADRWIALVDDCPWSPAGESSEEKDGSDDSANPPGGSAVRDAENPPSPAERAPRTEGEPEPPPPARAPGTPDRYSWTITARRADAHYTARLSEAEATGPWRALIDAVREADSGRRPAAPPQ